jgi:hypothetical protein
MKQSEQIRKEKEAKEKAEEFIRESIRRIKDEK